MNNKTIIEFGFRIIWRIMDISEGVIRRGRSIPYHTAVEWLSQHLQLQLCTTYRENLYTWWTITAQLILSWWIEPKNIRPKLFRCKTQRQTELLPDIRHSQRLLSYCGLSNCNWTPTLEQGWWVGEAGEGCGCVDGISTQSNPVSTDIDGAVETGCPY